MESVPLTARSFIVQNAQASTKYGIQDKKHTLNTFKNSGSVVALP
jgi:hypothetical protein